MWRRCRRSRKMEEVSNIVEVTSKMDEPNVRKDEEGE